MRTIPGAVVRLATLIFAMALAAHDLVHAAQDQGAAQRFQEWRVADEGAEAPSASAPGPTEGAPENSDGAKGDNAGPAQSEDEAFQQAIKDAEVGKVDAQILVGTHYDQQKNYPEAVKWLSKAAAQNSALAAWLLGLMYLYEKDLPPDHAKAFPWLLQAASANLFPAPELVAAMYYNGDGVPVDLGEARRWLLVIRENRLAANGAADLSKMDVAAEKLLAVMLARGEGGAVDFVTARQLYLETAKTGDAEAENNLALMYERGEGGPRDDKAAFALLTQAADQKLKEAEENLGRLYYRGAGTRRDYAAARALLQRAATQNDALAAGFLGFMCYRGLGGPRDPPEARRWMLVAAQAGIADAEDAIAMWYESGFGGPRDPVEARKWYERAAADGQPHAQQWLTASRHPGAVTSDASNSWRSCVSACRRNAYSCSSSNGFNNFMGVASHGLSLGTLMTNSMNNADCSGREQVCMARCR
jgi:TPR repeat protein